MLRFFLFIFLCCNLLVAHAQPRNSEDFSDISWFSVPGSESNTTGEIAAYIKKHFKTDEQKAKAAYAWVTANIKYDKDSIHYVVSDESRDERVTYAMRRRKGVCENFAAIFTDICLKSGLRSYMVEGFALENGHIKTQPHAWSATEIDTSWFLFDPTWDAGFSYSGSFRKANFFKVSPQDFITSHYPFDPLFQFLNYPVTYASLSKGNEKKRVYFNYRDSIKVLENSDSLSRYIARYQRIQKNGWPASLIDSKLKQTKLEIELIYQDDDMGNYNKAVAELNYATQLLNNFIVYRNDQFLPARKEDQVLQDFQYINDKLSQAARRLQKVNASAATLSLNTGDVEYNIKNIAEKAKQQLDFYNNYLRELKEKK